MSIKVSNIPFSERSIDLIFGLAVGIASFGSQLIGKLGLRVEKNVGAQSDAASGKWSLLSTRWVERKVVKVK